MSSAYFTQHASGRDALLSGVTPSRRCSITPDSHAVASARLRTSSVANCRPNDFRLGERFQVNADLKFVIVSAKNDPAERAHVTVVSAPGKRHVTVRGDQVVRGIHIEPT